LALNAARACVLLGLLACAACRRERPKPDRTEPWPASASATTPASATPDAPRRKRYTLAKSRVDFELPARKSTPRGRFVTLRGELDVDLEAPSRSTGSVEIELDSIELANDGAAEPARSPTERALAWLELGRGVPEDRRSRGRIATFSLRELQGGGERERPGAAEARALRTSDWEVKGDLALHGVRAPLATSVSLQVTSTDDGKAYPAELVIRSRRPLVVSLGTHDIRPRDENGVLLPREVSLLGDSVGREARVSFELVFVPGP
jgi:polyisoprenoid-binding protein YceI